MSRQILLQRIRDVVRWLPAARRCEPAAVHRARVATRRLREVLPIVTRGRLRRTLLKAARGITRALGPLRELDVALATLTQAASSCRMSAVSESYVQADIETERARLSARVARRLSRWDFDALAERAVESHGPARQTAQMLRVAADRRASRRAKRLHGAIERAGALYTPERLHQVRIAAKKLRYALELVSELRAPARPVRSEAAARRIRDDASGLKTLRRVQARLGEMHDLDVLAGRVRAIETAAGTSGDLLTTDGERLVRHLDEACRDLHGEYVAMRGDLLAVCERVSTAPARRTHA